MKTSRQLVVLAFAALAPLFASLATSHAATISWTNSAGGNWSVAANWSGGVLPAAADHVLNTAAGVYTVTQDVNVTAASLTLGGVSGMQTLTNAGFTLTLNSASVNQHQRRARLRQWYADGRRTAHSEWPVPLGCRQLVRRSPRCRRRITRPRRQHRQRVVWQRHQSGHDHLERRQ